MRPLFFPEPPEWFQEWGSLEGRVPAPPFVYVERIQVAKQREEGKHGGTRFWSRHGWLRIRTLRTHFPPATRLETVRDGLRRLFSVRPQGQVPRLLAAWRCRSAAGHSRAAPGAISRAVRIRRSGWRSSWSRTASTSSPGEILVRSRASSPGTAILCADIRLRYVPAAARRQRRSVPRAGERNGGRRRLSPGSRRWRSPAGPSLRLRRGWGAFTRTGGDRGHAGPGQGHGTSRGLVQRRPGGVQGPHEGDGQAQAGRVASIPARSLGATSRSTRGD